MSAELQALIILYPLFAVPAIVGSNIAYKFIGNHITLNSYHILSYILPWLVWWGLVAIDGREKPLENLIEPVWLGVFVAFLFLIQGLVSISKNHKISGKLFLSYPNSDSFKSKILVIFSLIS